MIESINSVFHTGIQDTPKKECESERMKHERIAQLIVKEMRTRGLKKVDGWAVYQGDNQFSYTLRAGNVMMMLKQ